MPKVLKAVVSKIGRLFRSRRKKPAPPKVVARQVWVRPGEGPGGHRGIAAEDLEYRRRQHAETGRAYTQEEMNKWRTVPASFVEDFIYNGALFPVHSSNVAAAQYHIETNQMMIEFLNGSAYLYSNVTPQEAMDFAQSASKSDFLWSYFRVRGSRTAHKKPYSRLR